MNPIVAPRLDLSRFLLDASGPSGSSNDYTITPSRSALAQSELAVATPANTGGSRSRRRRSRRRCADGLSPRVDPPDLHRDIEGVLAAADQDTLQRRDVTVVASPCQGDVLPCRDLVV